MGVLHQKNEGLFNCEESISGIGLCNTSSSSACIWLKATSQERQPIDIGDFTAPIDIVACPEKKARYSQHCSH